MASLSLRKDKKGNLLSQYWQIRFRDASGTRRREPTPYRWNNRLETRQARELEARKTFEEKRSPRATQRDRWQAWVRGYLEQRYHDSPKTAGRYLTCWKSLEAFLIERGAIAPGRVTHSLVMDYVSWRRTARRGSKRNKKPIATGTISTEIKVLRIVLEEAIRRGFTLTNPARGLGLSRKTTREMRALPLEEEAIIVDALAHGIPEQRISVTQTNQHGRQFTYNKTLPAWQPNEWMLRSFKIAMAQGCRFNETRVPLDEIKLHPTLPEKDTILIRGKGGKVFATALNPSLRPMMQDLIARGEKMTWDLPPDQLRQCGRQWTRFFRRLGVKDFWFHCTRATAITRAHEMGVSYPKAMKYFGHAGSLVHAIYTRLGTESVAEVGAALASYGSAQRNPYS